MNRFSKLAGTRSTRPEVLDEELFDVTGGCTKTCSASCGKTCETTCSNTCMSTKPFEQLDSGPN